MLGVVAMQTKRFEMAVSLIKEAIRLKGTMSTFHCDLGNALDSLGRSEEAIIAIPKRYGSIQTASMRTTIWGLRFSSRATVERLSHFERALAISRISAAPR